MLRKLSLHELGRVDAESFRRQPRLPLILIADHIRSLLNVGSLFRTADAFALEAVWLVGLTGQPPHRELEKTALGATETVPWRYFKTAAEACGALGQLNAELWVLEQTTTPTYLQEFTPVGGKLHALAVGHEVQGVSVDFLAAARGALEIQQFGTKHSLNVAVAAGIAVYEIAGKLRELQKIKC
jgi:tRNA G18 (ribose-2'-O)-methylase SpoU